MDANDGKRTAFDALLNRLAADGSPGGVGYEYLRRRLILFFDNRVPAEAEQLADAALDRVARRLAEGVIVDDVRLYALGVARFVLKERATRIGREIQAIADPTFVALDTASNENELQALEQCLGELGRTSASLILSYYDGDAGDRIRRRATLATELGLAINALRNRALRLRGLLEKCLSRRLGAGWRDGSDDSDT